MSETKTLTMGGKTYDSFVDATARNELAKVNCVTPQMFGAVGDGVADDTDAIRAARTTAIAEKKALYFPAGTYLIHGSIEMWSDCEIYGDGSRTIIKKTPAVIDVLKPKGETGLFTDGQNTFTVADGSRYSVGHDCYMGINWQTYDVGVYGKIASIDGNDVTVQAYPKRKVNETLLTGLSSSEANTLSKQKTLEVTFSTSFPVLCSYRYKTDGSLNALHDVYIHDLTIDGNRQENEVGVYHVSTIHFDNLDNTNTDYEKLVPTPHTNIRLENLNIRNSTADGISVQSSKNVCVTNCITENCGLNGVHFGVGTVIGSVVGCKLNADWCGYYDCAGVSSVSLSNNHFEQCPIGIGGLDQLTRGLTVTGNTFRGCGVGVQAGSTKYPQNIIKDHPTKVYVGTPSTGIAICNNTFYGVGLTGIGVSCTKGSFFIINGNTFRDLAKAIEVSEANGYSISNNVINDCASVLVVDSSTAKSSRIAFVGNVVNATIDGASAEIVITYANKMLATGNIVYGTNAGISVNADTTSDVIEENNITVANS